MCLLTVSMICGGPSWSVFNFIKDVNAQQILEDTHSLLSEHLLLEQPIISSEGGGVIVTDIRSARSLADDEGDYWLNDDDNKILAGADGDEMNFGFGKGG